MTTRSEKLTTTWSLDPPAQSDSSGPHSREWFQWSMLSSFEKFKIIWQPYTDASCLAPCGNIEPEASEAERT